MVLDLMQAHNFHYQLVNRVEKFFWCSLIRHADNRRKDILVLGEVPADEVDDISIIVEAKYSVNITKFRKKICLNLHYNAANSFFMLMV